MDDLTRRTVLHGVMVSLAATASRQAAAQPAAPRLAFVHSAIPVAELTEQTGPLWVRRFFETLRKLGLVEGRTLTVERFSAGGDSERFAGLVQKVVAGKPDVIVTNLNALIALFKTATSTIPIVGIAANPVETGLVASLSRPGGNVTGVSVDAGREIYPKQLQIIKEAIPSLSKLAILTTTDNWRQLLSTAAQQLNMTLFAIKLPQVGAGQLRQGFEDMARQGAQAVLVTPAGDFLAHRALLCELAARHRLPSLYPFREFVEAGGLMAYGPDLGELAQRMADNVQKILSGARAGDLPMYLPSRFELIINQKAAHQIGLSLPPVLLARAEEVIE